MKKKIMINDEWGIWNHAGEYFQGWTNRANLNSGGKKPMPRMLQIKIVNSDEEKRHVDMCPPVLWSVPAPVPIRPQILQLLPEGWVYANLLASLPAVPGSRTNKSNATQIFIHSWVSQAPRLLRVLASCYRTGRCPATGWRGNQVGLETSEVDEGDNVHRVNSALKLMSVGSKMEARHLYSARCDFDVRDLDRDGTIEDELNFGGKPLPGEQQRLC